MTRSLCSSTNQALAITVTAVNEFSPVFTSAATASFAENATGRAKAEPVSEVPAAPKRKRRT